MDMVKPVYPPYNFVAGGIINTIVTDMECNIRIDRLPLGSLYILILPSISVTII
jgi:hypothetical protein